MSRSATSLTTAPCPPGAIGLIADDRTARRLAGAVLRYRFSRPATWVNLAVLAAIAMAIGFFCIGDPVRMAFLLIIVIPVVGYLQYLTLVRLLRRPYGPGTVHWVLHGPATIVIAGPLGVSEVRYETFQQVWSTTTAVLLRVRHVRTAYLLPIELAPGPELARLRSMVGQ